MGIATVLSHACYDHIVTLIATPVPLLFTGSILILTDTVKSIYIKKHARAFTQCQSLLNTNNKN